jgi:hypothetical protein
MSTTEVNTGQATQVPYIVAREQGRTPEEAAKDGALQLARTREQVRV